MDKRSVTSPGEENSRTTDHKDCHKLEKISVTLILNKFIEYSKLSQFFPWILFGSTALNSFAYN